MRTTTPLAETYCIYITIPSSCVWFPGDFPLLWLDRAVMLRSPKFRAFAKDSVAYGAINVAHDYARSILFFVWVFGESTIRIPLENPS